MLRGNLKDHQNQQESIYLIANNKKLQRSLFPSIPEGSICVHFNHAIYLAEMRTGRNWLVMNCCDPKNGGFWGYGRNKRRKNRFEKVFFCLPPECEDKKPWCDLMCDFGTFTLIRSEKYPHNGAYCSAGYSTTNHFRKDHAVVLVGFSFSGWKGHDWSYERAQVEQWGEVQKMGH